MINGVELSVGRHKNSLVDSRSGNLLILAGGKNVWNEYAEARQLFDSTGYNNGRYEIMCVNDIAGQFKAEKIHHAVSLHKRILPAVRLLRIEKSMLEKITTHSNTAGDGVDISWNMHNCGGTSGLFAVMIALVLGYKKIIACGVPMDNSGHYFDPDDINVNHAPNFGNNKASINPWMDVAKRDIPKERVRCMSGRTATLFGEPTKEWAA